MTAKDVLLCTCFSIALAIGQTIFKMAALYNAKLSGPWVVRLATNWPLIGAFAWYGLTSLLWVYILTRVPLSLAYAFAIAGSGLVPLIAWLYFKEPVSWRFAVGYMLMLCGFLVIVQGRVRA